VTKQLLTTASAIIISLALATATRAGEVEIPIEKLPEAIQKTMRETVGKGTIAKTVKETEKDGSVIYEVAYTVGTRKFEAEVSPKGKLLVIDEQIELSEAPDAVQKAIKDKTAGGKITKVEKATKGKEVFYEAEFVKDGKEHEVKVAPSGKVLAVE
jgi:uncharacterized membrane protein YkoI